MVLEKVLFIINQIKMMDEKKYFACITFRANNTTNHKIRLSEKTQ